MIRLDRELDIDDVPRHRHEECKSYERCLDAASKSRWPSFSCQGCREYAQSPDFPIEPLLPTHEVTWPCPGGRLSNAENITATAAMRKLGVKIPHFTNLGCKKGEAK